jgi:hypothetical protein
MSFNEKVERISDSVVKFVLIWINAFFDIISGIMTHIFRIIDRGHLSRRFAVWSGIGLTIYSLLWCLSFAGAPPKAYPSGTDVAAIIAAVLTPISFLTGALMKFGEQYKGISRATEKEGDDKSSHSDV